MAKLALGIVGAVLLLFITIGPYQFEIQSPRMGSPLILSKAESQSWQVDIRGNWPFALGDFSVELKHRLTGQKYQLAPSSTLHKAPRVIQLTLGVENNLPIGAYDLLVEHHGQQQVRKKALHI